MKWTLQQGLSLLVLAAFCVGCTKGLPVEDGVIVKAKLLRGGQPLGGAGGEDMPPGMEDSLGFDIALVPDGAGEVHLRGSYVGEYSIEDGSVIFEGPGKGIPPGNYVLTVQGDDSMPDDAETDPFEGKFQTETSPFTFEIPAGKVGGEHDLGVIDLDNPPG